jgi:A118 family predicted phage portal protein
MFDRNIIKSKTGITVCISEEMRHALELWDAIYYNRAPWIDETTKSINLGAQIATEFARLITLELKSEVTGSARAEYINGVYSQILKSLRRQVERACATGGIVVKPYLSGGRIYMDFADNTMFYPTSYDSDGDITGAVFVAQKVIGDKYYTKLECHDYRDGTETIRNLAYMSRERDCIGREVSLTAVDEWAQIAPEATIMNIPHPMFAYYRMPVANAVDPQSPLGASVYSRAVDLLAEADKQWSRLLWEMEGGELAIDADASLLEEDEDGKIYMDARSRRLYRKVMAGNLDKDFYNVFSPSLRDESLINGLNTIFKRIEFNCSLAYGTLSDPQNVDKTAEEIRASKQRSYAAVSDMQQELERTLRRVVDIIDIWCTIGRLAPKGRYEVGYEWDDSIISDRQREFTERQMLVSLGVMKPYEMRAWYLGESEEQAQKMIAGAMEDEEE